MLNLKVDSTAAATSSGFEFEENVEKDRVKNVPSRVEFYSKSRVVDLIGYFTLELHLYI